MHFSIIKKKTNINDLLLEEKKLLVKNIYTTPSYFQNLFNQESIEIDFQHYPDLFREELVRLLCEKEILPHTESLNNLETLHEFLSDEMKAYNFDDGVNKISTYFYDTDENFLNIYYQFIRFLRKNFLREPFWFQATPTLRIHCPNAKNNHHYPRYHSDISYGHPPEEMNIWFPLTKCLNKHGFRTMSLAHSKKILEQFDYNFADFIDNAIHNKPFSNYCDTLSQIVTTEYGKMLAFDSRCIHTGEPLTSHTRISIDIRILPVSQYENMHLQYQGSGRRKVIFEPGHCYHQEHSDNI
ncbi:MAG: hypothetical protein A3F42_06725 [Gammaproteobacteria bacterium RIFCSPHIGHO2_12_FULL_37_34]|nr:MAG: hypothetical protein A3F42_06725 [Gammaproteobacteria bacterium RIFCSPHIGHO2_12_FULL_37_34]